MNKEKLLDCHARITPYIHDTPVLTSGSINKIAGTSIFFKCQNFQRAGAYKIRGATNAMLLLSNEQRSNGVVTHSSGNFAQAVALAAKSLGITAHLVCRLLLEKKKKIGVMEYGGTMYECEPTLKARQAMADK